MGKNGRSDKPPSIKPIPFGERPGREPYNASEIVAIGDGRFLFCDNNIGDALFELRVAADGSLAGPLMRRPIQGLEPGQVDDLEGMTIVDPPGAEGDGLIFAIPSLCLKQRKKKHQKRSERGKSVPQRNCLMRIALAGDELQAEVLPGFREWVVENAPVLGKAPRYLPDDGGLNVEGLGWSPEESTLLLGVRTPVIEGRPLVLRVRVKDLHAPLALANLEMLPPVHLAALGDQGEEGIRTIGSAPSRGLRLIVTGNSTSDSKAPFRLYAWDGNSEGAMRHFAGVRFHKKMRVEGVTHGTIGGRGAVIVVDDLGGYQILWDDDPRLAMS